MTARQELINNVAKTLARTNDGNQEIKVIEITTDENEEYVETATDKQWQLYSNEVIKLAKSIREGRGFNEEIIDMMTTEEMAAIEEGLGL